MISRSEMISSIQKWSVQMLYYAYDHTHWNDQFAIFQWSSCTATTAWDDHSYPALPERKSTIQHKNDFRKEKLISLCRRDDDIFVGWPSRKNTAKWSVYADEMNITPSMQRRKRSLDLNLNRLDWSSRGSVSYWCTHADQFDAATPNKLNHQLSTCKWSSMTATRTLYDHSFSAPPDRTSTFQHKNDFRKEKLSSSWRRDDDIFVGG